jgi:hypothetical protein
MSPPRVGWRKVLKQGRAEACEDRLTRPSLSLSGVFRPTNQRGIDSLFVTLLIAFGFQDPVLESSSRNW